MSHPMSNGDEHRDFQISNSSQITFVRTFKRIFYCNIFFFQKLFFRLWSEIFRPHKFSFRFWFLILICKKTDAYSGTHNIENFSYFLTFVDWSSIIELVTKFTCNVIQLYLNLLKLSVEKLISKQNSFKWVWKNFTIK